MKRLLLAALIIFALASPTFSSPPPIPQTAGDTVMVYPGAGIAVSGGESGPWGASLQTGDSAGDIPLLQSGGKLKSTWIPTLNQSTTGTSNGFGYNPADASAGWAIRGIDPSGNAENAWQVTPAAIGALPTAGTAADSSKLGGLAPDAYQPSLGTVGSAGVYCVEETVLGVHGIGACGFLPVGGTAVAAGRLATAPTGCQAGNYPTGWDASGNATSCTAVPTQASLSVDDLITLSGAAEGSVVLGSLGAGTLGTSLGVNLTIKGALTGIVSAFDSLPGGHVQNEDTAVSSPVMIGTGGIKLKTNSGVLEVRNNADSAYDDLKALTIEGTTITATTRFMGNVTGDVSGNVTGSSGSTTGNAATATSAGKSTNLIGGNSTTLLGSMPYQSNTDTTTLLSPNTTSTKKFLRMTGNGTNGAAPAWDTLASSDIPNNAADTTGTASKATNLKGGNTTTLLGAIGYQSAVDTTTLLGPNTTTTKKFLRMTGDGTNGTAPAWDTLVAGDVPTLNQDSSGYAGSLKSVATTGKITVTGPGTGTTRAKTVRDADDTILELGGSYTPTGTWVWTSASVTWPTFNQSTSGTAAGLSGTPNITVGTISAGGGAFLVASNGGLTVPSITYTKVNNVPGQSLLYSSHGTDVTGAGWQGPASAGGMANSYYLAMPEAESTVAGQYLAATGAPSSHITTMGWYGPAVPVAGGTMTGKLIGVTPAAGGSGYASFNLPPGAAPTTNLADGDIWTTSAGLYVRVNSSTVGPLAAAGGSPALDSVTNPTGAKTFTLLDDNASALSFGATGKADILKIITTNNGESVSMSGTLGVTGLATLTGGASLGSTLAMGANNITSTGSLGATGAGKLTKVWTIDLESTNLPTVNGGTLATALGLPTLTDASLNGTTKIVAASGTNTLQNFLYRDPVTGQVKEASPSAGAGNVSKVGTPSDYQVGVWTGNGTLKGITLGNSMPMVTTSNGEPSSNFTLPTGTLLANASGLPIAGLVASTSTALGVGSVELGHASDTTIARAAAGQVTIEGNYIITDASGQASPAYASTGTTDQGTKNINIDGQYYSRYLYSPLAGTAGTYTPVITSAPASGKVRYVELVIGGGTNGVTTITWTNVDALGPAFATSVAGSKYNHYACMIPSSGHAQCSIISEGGTY